MFKLAYIAIVVLVNLGIARVSLSRGGAAAVIMAVNYSPILNGLCLLLGIACLAFSTTKDRRRQVLIVVALPIIFALLQLLLALLQRD
jgi:hypothetical protein